MSVLKHQSTWTVSASTSELRLILKALGGRLKPEEVADAEALGDRLTAERAAVLREVARTATQLDGALAVPK